jgi:hypothetical protein
MVTNIFKPNATLGNVVGELKELSKDFTKEDHVIIVGGPGNSLDRDLNYKIENDINSIAKNSTHTNVGFVGLLERHDRPHMNKWVRSVNIRLERALWDIDKTHIGLIDVSSLNRYDHTRQGLHLNLRGKVKLVQIIANEITCKPDTGKIPVITGVNSRPFLG